jgi:hypothetical protein
MNVIQPEVLSRAAAIRGWIVGIRRKRPARL